VHVRFENVTLEIRCSFIGVLEPEETPRNIFVRMSARLYIFHLTNTCSLIINIYQNDILCYYIFKANTEEIAALKILSVALGIYPE